MINKVIKCLLVLTITTTSIAQEIESFDGEKTKTLFKKKIKNNDDDEFKTLFGINKVRPLLALDIAYMNLNNYNMLYPGLNLGVIINNKLTFGFGFYGGGKNDNKNSMTSSTTNEGSNKSYDFSYQGLLIGFTPLPKEAVHLSFPILIGFGNAVIDENNHKTVTTGSTTTTTYEVVSVGNSSFFILDPKVELEINLTNALRISTGIGYRFVSGINERGMKNSHIGGFSAALSVKLGMFK